MELAEFLLARVADDEAYARMAFADHNDNGPEWSEIWSGTVELGGTDPELLGCNDSGVSRHIERWDPARVLAECDAKRRLVKNERAARAAMGSAPLEQLLLSQDGPASAYWRGQDWVLRVHAATYAEHPDYREEWRP